MGFFSAGLCRTLRSTCPSCSQSARESSAPTPQARLQNATMTPDGHTPGLIGRYPHQHPLALLSRIILAGTASDGSARTCSTTTWPRSTYAQAVQVQRSQASQRPPGWPTSASATRHTSRHTSQLTSAYLCYSPPASTTVLYRSSTRCVLCAQVYFVKSPFSCVEMPLPP